MCNCNIKLLIYFLVSCEEKIDAFMLDGMKSQVYSFSLSFHRFSAKTNKLKLWKVLPPQLVKWVDPVFIFCIFFLGYSATFFFSLLAFQMCLVMRKVFAQLDAEANKIHNHISQSRLVRNGILVFSHFSFSFLAHSIFYHTMSME